MKLPFMSDVVNDTNNVDLKQLYTNRDGIFIGYLTPKGLIMDYAYPLGLTGHTNNAMTDFFKEYVMPIEFTHWGNEEEERDFLREEFLDIRKSLESQLEQIKKQDSKTSYATEWDFLNVDHCLKRAMVNFLVNCYQNESFELGLGKKGWHIMTAQEFFDSLPQDSKARDRIFFDDAYTLYKNDMLVHLLKSVFVEYLGYHAVERVKRTITTSSLHPYEEFYEYIDRGFTIMQISKMIYNPDERRYEEYRQNEFLIPDKELRLRDELISGMSRSRKLKREPVIRLV